MSGSSVQRLYRFHAPIYDWTRWAFLFGRKRAVRALALRSDDAVLEIGCGTGLNFPLLIDGLDPGAGRLTGLDFSLDMLRKARKRSSAKEWRHVDLVGADACRMPFRRSFDAILFAYSLTMIPDWPCALESAHRQLKPGGRLAVLDFGTFPAWGPLGALPRFWLRLHHVEPNRPYVEKMKALFPDFRRVQALGGYYFIGVGTKSEPA
ncbi:MAG: class I SAM-dependent methyltransferase [Planctomycetota bacterium]